MAAERKKDSMWALRNKKVLGVGLVAVLAVGLTACDIEKGPNDTAAQAEAYNTFVYNGGTFEGGGALRQAQYPTVSGANDETDIFVLQSGGALPAGNYRLSTNYGQDPSMNRTGLPTLATAVLEYKAANGSWKNLGAAPATCTAGTPCLGSVTVNLPQGVTAMRVTVRPVYLDPALDLFAGTYSFKVARV